MTKESYRCVGRKCSIYETWPPTPSHEKIGLKYLEPAVCIVTTVGHEPRLHVARKRAIHPCKLETAVCCILIACETENDPERGRPGACRRMRNMVTEEIHEQRIEVNSGGLQEQPPPCSSVYPETLKSRSRTVCERTLPLPEKLHTGSLAEDNTFDSDSRPRLAEGRRMNVEDSDLEIYDEVGTVIVICATASVDQ